MTLPADALTDDSAHGIPVIPVTDPAEIPDPHRAWAQAHGFGPAGTWLGLPGDDGLAGVLAAIDPVAGPHVPPWRFAHLPMALPVGTYRLAADLPPAEATACALDWALGAWRYDRYKAAERAPARLVWPAGADRAEVTRLAAAIALCRELVSTPAADLGPAELADRAVDLARHHGGQVRVIEGEDLLARNYPMIHAVGQGSARAPRLIDLRWGDDTAPKLTLVGKGVVFDSGGLNLKPGKSMDLMKKDMGGAAHVLALAQLVMDRGLPVRLRVLIPAVENAVSGRAFRPGDILRSRKGTTVVVGNTDAEGRLILADALTEAMAEQPDLVLDLATLTGAARTALGPDLPALFSNDDSLAADLLAAAETTGDPLWRLPLWPGYRKRLESPVADLSNAPDWPFAGAITAALFLESFVESGTPWAHMDLYAWNPSARPGRPEGGEAQGLRALDRLLRNRFGQESESTSCA